MAFFKLKNCYTISTLNSVSATSWGMAFARSEVPPPHSIQFDPGMRLVSVSNGSTPSAVGHRNSGNTGNTLHGHSREFFEYGAFEGPQGIPAKCATVEDVVFPEGG